jgi:hypothetical protein
MVVHRVDILGVRAATPNETELSYRWRVRAFITSTMCFINSSWSSRQPAVSWSDLLDAFIEPFEIWMKLKILTEGLVDALMNDANKFV